MIRIGARDVGFGKVMAVHSRDLVRLSKTVRIRPRGVQRVMCRVKDSTRVGQEVLVEGTAKSSNELFVVPSLEVIREDGSLPLTLENQSTSFKEVKLGMVVAKITMLPERRAGMHLEEDVNQSSDGGESPPALRKWHIPTHVASVNAVGTRHGKE
jgi:hypothetical protein